MTSVTLSGLSLSYNGGAPVVDQVDITVPRGELMVLLGPSGSGKTSLLRLIAGLVPPDNGDVLFAGSSVLDVPPDKRGAVMVFQDDALFPFRTVSENVAFGLRMRRTHRTERRSGSRMRSRRCISQASRTDGQTSSLVVSANALHWPGHWSYGQPSCFSTSR